MAKAKVLDGVEGRHAARAGTGGERGAAEANRQTLNALYNQEMEAIVESCRDEPTHEKEGKTG